MARCRPPLPRPAPSNESVHDVPEVALRETGRRRALRFARGAAIDLTPLRHEHFRRLWTGNSIAFVGFAVTSVAVPVQVYDVTGSSFWVGLLGAVGLVPLIVFGLWGGAIADAVDRRVLLIGSSLLLWGCTLVLFVQAVAGWANLALLLVLVAVQSAAFAVASSTRGAVLPRVLPAADVASANTLSFTASTAAAAVGPLLAGPLVDRHWFGAAYGLDAVLFTLALYAAVRLPSLPPLRRHPDAAGAAPAAARSRAALGGRGAGFHRDPTGAAAVVRGRHRRDGARHAEGAVPAGRRREVRRRGRLAVRGDRARLRGGRAVVGVGPTGAAAGGRARAGRRRVGPRRGGVGARALAAGRGAPAGMVAGAADLVSAVYRQTILQTYAPDDMRGRLQGVFIVVVAGGPRLGDLRAGATAAAFGLNVAWVGGGIACVAVVLPALLVPALRHYDASEVISSSR